MKIFILSYIILTLILVNAANAQSLSPIPLECGAIVGGEITTATQEVGDFFSIALSPGDVIRVEVIPVANTFSSTIALFDPSNREMIRENDVATGQINSFEIQIPATGFYQIWVVGRRLSYIGAYTLQVSCRLQNGTVITAGDTPPSVTTPPIPATAVPPAPPTELAADFKGFPGLPPVDFSSVVAPPLPIGTPLTSVLPPDGSLVVGFTFDANAGDVAELVFTRMAGNLNIGMAVLTTDNKVVFETSLVTAESQTTRIRLPAAGTYTLGFYRIDLLLLATPPEPTTFSVQVNLNPT